MEYSSAKKGHRKPKRGRGLFVRAPVPLRVNKPRVSGGRSHAPSNLAAVRAGPDGRPPGRAEYPDK